MCPGSLPFLLIYIVGGIYGNVLGGSFALVGIPSAGASGAIFSAEGVLIVDLVMHWKHIDRPGRKVSRARSVGNNGRECDGVLLTLTLRLSCSSSSLSSSSPWVTC